jgi:hypothetical protein
MKSILESPVRETIPLWERWTSERLRRRREEIGETAFNRGFRNIAFSDSDLLFPNIDRHIVVGKSYDDYIMAHFPRFAGVDLSGKSRSGNAIVVIGVIPQTGQRVLIDVQRGAWTSTQTAEMISMMVQKYRLTLVKVENNAYQQSLLDWMATGKYKGIPLASHTTGANKSHPEFGLPGMAAELERGAWIFPIEREHDVSCSCGKCTFFADLRSYPLGVESDTVMAWWFAREAAGPLAGSGIQNIITGKRTDAGEIFKETF